MKKSLFIFGIFCTIVFSNLAFAQAVTLKLYQKGDWASLTKSANGQPLAIHIWGVTCAPCMKEMPKWGKFLTKNKSDRVIFLQVDDVPVSVIEKMLVRANLAQANNYYFATSFDEYLRYEIDPKWRGETPITILIDRSDKVERVVGPIDFSDLKKWFNR